MPAGDVFGLDGIFLSKSNPVTVSVVDINSATTATGIAVTGGSFSSGTITLNLSSAAGLTTTPFYVGAIVGVSNLVRPESGVAHTAYNGTFVVTGFAGTTTVSYASTGYVGSVTAGIGTTTTTTGYIRLLTDGTVTNTIWSDLRTHGWYAGGIAGPLSSVDRIDFSNDTGVAIVRGSLNNSVSELAATGNSNYGWFAGGGPSSVDRINFANDSSTSSARGPLTAIKNRFAATSNPNYGWFGGSTSTVDRIDFSNDSSTSSARGPLSLSRNRLAAAGNINFGWFVGGTAGTRVDRIDFSNDSTTASIRGSLDTGRELLAGTSNQNYGWFGGGSPITSIVNRIDFSNDLPSVTLRGSLNSSNNSMSAAGNSNYGWFGGGSPGPLSRIDRIDFSNDSATASVRGRLSVGRAELAATSGQARSSSTLLIKQESYGWFGGGIYFTPTFTSVIFSTVDRVDFSNDSAAALVRGSLNAPAGRYGMAATGNSNYGWFGGGYVAARVSLVDRIDFSNDSLAASPRGLLNQPTYSLAATGNRDYGWFGAGNGSVLPTESICRIDFSNDLAGVSARGSLTATKYRAAATGNTNYGWFGGGSPGPAPSNTASSIDRITFSNDSVTASPRGRLNEPRQNPAATGNSNFGWFTGGTTPGISPAWRSLVDRINFSNDSVISLSRGTLTLGRDQHAAAGNSNYGWFGAGSTGPVPTSITNTLERINFSNDSVTASTRGSLSSPGGGKYLLAATSNRSR